MTDISDKALRERAEALTAAQHRSADANCQMEMAYEALRAVRDEALVEAQLRVHSELCANDPTKANIEAVMGVFRALKSHD